MRDALCKGCAKKFRKKDIYTIQQFQYRKVPPYAWSLEYFERLGMGEWDSFCEGCITEHAKESLSAWESEI